MSMRVQTDMSTIEPAITHELRVLRQCLKPRDGTKQDYALCCVEQFVAIALRVMSKTDPEMLKSEARTFEIGARLAGLPEARRAG